MSNTRWNSFLKLMSWYTRYCFDNLQINLQNLAFNTPANKCLFFHIETRVKLVHQQRSLATFRDIWGLHETSTCNTLLHKFPVYLKSFTSETPTKIGHITISCNFSANFQVSHPLLFRYNAFRSPEFLFALTSTLKSSRGDGTARGDRLHRHG